MIIEQLLAFFDIKIQTFVDILSDILRYFHPDIFRYFWHFSNIKVIMIDKQLLMV